MHKFILQIDKNNIVIINNSISLPFLGKSIPSHQSFDILKTLAALGKIHFKGQDLIVDLFSKVPICLEASKISEGQFKIDAKILLPKPIYASECAFIAACSPIWFIHDKKLKVMDPNVSYLDLADMPKIVNTKQLLELQSEKEVVFLFSDPIEKDPIPVFKLTDKTGAFGNLYMDYGSHISPFNPLKSSEKFWEKDLLETDFQKKVVGNSQYYCPMNKVSKSLSFLLELGWKIFDFRDRKIILENKTELEILKDNVGLQLKGKISFDHYEVDLSNIVGTFNKKEKFIELGNHQVGFLKENNEIHSLVEEIEIIGSKATLKPHKIGLLKEADFLSWSAHPELKNLIEGISKPIKPDSSFRGTLRPYQEKGLNWLNSLYQLHFHGILADDMGLGKTIQVLAFLSLRSCDACHLIVVPTSLIFNWANEISKFVPEMNFYCHHGNKKESQFPKKGIILTSYHTLKNDLPLFKEPFWDCIVLDEAQAIKNADTQIAQSLFTLKSRFRLSMTGTVIENHAKELWTHFNFLMPGLLGSIEDFENTLQLAQIDFRYSKKIQKLIRPFILRRKKEEVAKDLPPLQEQTLFIEMTKDQRQHYDQFLIATKNQLVTKVNLEKSSKYRMEIFEALLRLRQLSCHPLLLSHPTSSGKMETLLMDLEAIREEGKKAIIFSQFASMLHIIAKELNNQKIAYSLLEGATINREAEVKKFQEDKEVSFFLITLKAGGVGLNLTSADYVIIFDPWWHEAAEAQAISRAHRIGQTKPVMVKKYICAESVEEKMLKLKKAKSTLFNQLLEDSLTESSFNLEDMLFLLDP